MNDENKLISMQLNIIVSKNDIIELMTIKRVTQNIIETENKNSLVYRLFFDFFKQLDLWLSNNISKEDSLAISAKIDLVLKEESLKTEDLAKEIVDKMLNSLSLNKF